MYKLNCHLILTGFNIVIIRYSLIKMPGRRLSQNSVFVSSSGPAEEACIFLGSNSSAVYLYYSKEAGLG